MDKLLTTNDIEELLPKITGSTLTQTDLDDLADGYYYVWEPQPKQALLLSCPADEKFFGGSKGGGKSDAILGGWISHADRGGKHARGIIFRRSNSELEELIQRSREMFEPLGAVYKIAARTWTFPNGAILKMRFLEKDADVGKYQGHSYSYIAIDELGNYPTPYVYDNMLSCLRSVHGVKCEMISSGNPGGVGHGWVKRRFIAGKIPNRIYKYEQIIKVDGKEKKIEFTRCFIPSSVYDNKKLIENDPKYLARLEMLPDQLKRAFLHGDWDVFIGQVFGEIREDKHYIKRFLLPRHWPKFATIDWGYSKPYSIGYWTVTDTGRLIRIHEDYGCVPGMENVGVQRNAKEVAARMIPFLNAFGTNSVYADPACWQKHGHGLSIAAIFDINGVKLKPAKRDRKAGLAALHTMLQNVDSEGRPLFEVMDHCTAWIRTVPNLVGSKTDIEDVDTDGEDHAYDDTRFAVLSPEVQRGTDNWACRIHSNHRYLEEDRDYAL